jgi:ferredoxin
MRVSVDPDRCEGHALCVLSAPELFDLDDVTLRSAPLMVDVPPALADLARSAEGGCPEGAITVTP